MNKSVLFIAFAAVLLSFISFKSISNDNENGRLPYGFPDSTVKAMLTVLDLKYSKTPLFTKLDDQYLFYVCKGTWVDTSKSKGKNKALMGIVNEKQEVILPVEYTKLYTPDATSRGYIEIEKNGKRGLVNYHTKKVIQCDYDVIYPTDDWTSIAIGKIDRDFYYIYANADRELIIPDSYMADVFSWDIEISRAKPTTLLYDSYPEKMIDNGNEFIVPYKATGVYISPSYLLSLRYIPAVFTEVDIKGVFEVGITNLKTKTIDSRFNKKTGLQSFITSIEHMAIAGRGEILEHNYIINMDKQASPRSFVEITEPNNSYLYYIEDENGIIEAIYKPSFKNDSIVEVHYTTDSVMNFSKYDYLTYRSYYKVNRNSNIEKLESNRIFDMTKFIMMSENDFKGVFIAHNAGVDEESKGRLTLSFDMEDLDLMRNEIYADYGLKFKTEKWNKYFSKQAWYTPKYDNVETYLTAIDKSNLKLILEFQEKLKYAELLITQPKLVTYYYGY